MATELSPYQKDILVKTILSEARGEGIDGMSAVAHVIANRANSGQFARDPAAVALQPNQFSGWNAGEGGNNPSQFKPGTRQYNQALQVIDRVFSGQSPDPTNGALYYHTPSVNPSWSGAVNRYGTNQIGNHIFYNGRPTPPGEIPNQVASLQDTTPPPRVAPNPATISPDLSLMRNPIMSSAAANAQVTRTPFPAPPRGMISPGNINPNNRPVVQNPDGSYSTVRTISANIDGGEVLMPTISPSGQNWTDDQAVNNYMRTGQSFGVFSTPDAATQFAERLHNTQEQQYASPSPNVPLPQRRPSAPDIVTPSMAAVNAQRGGNVNATRAVDMLAATQNPVTPRLTADGSNIYSYHIPDMTPTTVTGGMGSLTPSPARVRLPELPPSNIGQPPTTRVVQSVPVTASSMPKPSTSQINQAARRAALTATQSNVERAIPAQPPAAVTATQPFNPRARDSNYAANTALGERVAAQIAPVFNQPAGWTPTRLVPNPIVQPTNVALNQPPIQVVPAPQRTASVPLPRARPNIQTTPAFAPTATQAPLRIVVNGGNQVASALSTQAPAPQPMTVVQALRAQGLTPSDAYAVANQRAREQAYERANGPDTRSDYFKSVTGG